MIYFTLIACNQRGLGQACTSRKIPREHNSVRTNNVSMWMKTRAKARSVACIYDCRVALRICNMYH